MNFDQALHFVITYGYFFVFLMMVIEGPIITVVSAFAAALGYFNIYIIFGLALIGNLIPDLIYYSLGYWGRTSFIEKHSNFFGFKTKHIDKLEKISKDNIVKSLMVVKIIPFFAAAGLITAGAMKIKFSKYLKWISIIIFCNSLFYLIIGYFFGSTYKTFDKYFDLNFYLIVIIVIIVALILFAYKKATEKILRVIDSK